MDPCPFNLTKKKRAGQALWIFLTTYSVLGLVGEKAVGLPDISAGALDIELVR